MEVFLNHVKENFEKRQITFEKINTDYLEIYFLTWERDKHLDISELKMILKIMNEDRLYDLLDTALSQVLKCFVESLQSMINISMLTKIL